MEPVSIRQSRTPRMNNDIARLSGTGEHGVGLGKKEYLIDELGKGTVDLMKRIKNTLDPNHIMNPGKVSNVDIFCIS